MLLNSKLHFSLTNFDDTYIASKKRKSRITNSITDSPTALPQDLVSVVGPVHPVLQGPPLIQLRDRVIVPLPHRTEQALKGPHAPIRDGTKHVWKF